MAVPLDTQQDICEMDARGIPRARMSRRLGVSRNTVAKYADMRGMSPRAPMPETRPRPAIDARAAWVGSVLEADLGAPRKQRHTARGILGRLAGEGGVRGLLLIGVPLRGEAERGERANVPARRLP